ncbi:MAG: hypothetical protein FWE13_06525 [Firmicutes bacterium]|nr:hypothetical protein [Bacillota bacterium]
MIKNEYINPFLEVVKKSNAYLHLEQAVNSNHLSHAYIIQSEDNIASLLLTRSITSLCVEQKNLALEGRHPDVYEAPKGTEKKDNIKIVVADIDAIIEDAIKRPVSGDKKFYILNNFDSSNIQSQNKLLKSLEEPNKGTHFFLLVANTNALVPPVLSRCQKITLNKFDIIDIQSALSQVKSKADKEQLAIASELSGGNITETLSYIENKKKPQVFNAVLEVLQNLRTSKDVLSAVALLTPFKDFVPDMLQLFGVILRDVMLLHTNDVVSISLKSYIEELQELKNLYSLKAISNIFLHLQHIAKRNAANANFNSLLDDLVFSLAQHRSKR